MNELRLFLLIAIISVVPMTMSGQTNGGGSFRMAFLQMNGESDVKVISNNRENRNVISRNMDYKLFFRPLKSAYLYIVLLGPNDELKLLFPSSFKDFSRRYETFVRHIPEDLDWQQLFAGQGEYQLHILVSDNRLIDLEKLLTDYAKLTKSEDRLLLKSNLLFTIKKLKRKHYFPESIKREPVFEAGVIRSGDQKLEQYAERVDFKGLYGEVYYIE